MDDTTWLDRWAMLYDSRPVLAWALHCGIAVVGSAVLVSGMLYGWYLLATR